MAKVLSPQVEDGARIADQRLDLTTTRPGAAVEGESRHRIVVVGGGAAGLDLVTRLGDRLDRRRRHRL